MLVYQIGGDSQVAATVGRGNWRCLAVEKLSRIGLVRKHGGRQPFRGRPRALMKWISMSTIIPKIRSRGNAALVAVTSARG